jgi:hypothetical protein
LSVNRWPSLLERLAELCIRFSPDWNNGGRWIAVVGVTTFRGWFRLVQNTIAKYGIRSDDIWNFDETGFMMRPYYGRNGYHRFRKARKTKISAAWKS